MNSTRSKNLAILILLPLVWVEGFTALAALLIQRSEKGSALFYGYSPARLGLVLSVLAVLSLLAWPTWKVIRSSDYRALIQSWLDEQMIGKKRLLPATFVLLVVITLQLTVTVLLSSPATSERDHFLTQFSAHMPQWVGLLQVNYLRMQPIFLWMLLVSIEGLGMLASTYTHAYLTEWRSGRLPNLLLAAIIVVTTVFQWVVLFFRLKTFLVIAGWKWYFYEKIFPASYLLIFAAVLAITITLAMYAIRNPQHSRRSLVLLILCGAMLQISFGFIEGKGFESLRIKYADGVFSRYAQVASQEPGFVNSLLNYEKLYGNDWYLGTKPPGVLATYIIMDRASNIVLPQPTPAARFLRATQFSAYTFPILAYLVLIPLYVIGRKLFQLKEDAILPAILYIVCPNVILIPMFLDQALYPLLAMMVLLLLMLAIERHSLSLAFAVGGALYAALYFSFSLLPLLPLGVFWIVLDGWLKRKETPFLQTIKLLSFMGLGFLALFLVLRFTMNYDILVRYQNAMIAHRRAKEFQPGIEQIFKSIFLNNAEFSTWTGFPMLFLLLAQIFISVKAFLLRSATRLDALLASLIATYIILNFIGQTNGEVQRLWLFLVPLVSLFAAGRTKNLFENKSGGFILIIILQLITTFLTFKYQDFYG